MQVMTRVGALVAAAAAVAVGAPGTASAVAAASAGAPASAGAQAPSGRAVARPVVLVGVPGLRWSDLSPAATPALWRLAGAGSVGNLVVHTIPAVTCPADGWLTLGAGARAASPRAAAPRSGAGNCPALPAVVLAGRSGSGPAASGPAAHRPVPARIPLMASLRAYNQQFHYGPDWGLLRSAAGAGRCAAAVGPGAALALADGAGQVSGYLAAPPAVTARLLASCPLTVVDLGAVPAARSPAARAAAVRADDRAVGRLAAMLPGGTMLVVAALADDGTQHLRPIIVDGPGYAAGRLDSASTRQPGLVQITDITPTVLRWRGLPVPAGVVGASLTRAGRPGVATEIRDLNGQDTAAQVYRTTFGWFFAIFAVAEAVVFGAIAWLLRGRQGQRDDQRRARRRRRRAACRAAGVAAGSVPAGTFLASLVPWWMFAHPAVALYALTAAWAAVIAAVALAGPWRRDPLGPAGLVGAVTVAVVGIDVMTGSRLQLSTPFGLNVLWGGRFYGEDNNTVGIYGASAILCVAWLGAAVARSRAPRAGAGRPGAGRPGGAERRLGTGLLTGLTPRGRAVLAVSAVALFAVVASGWPGFGAKVGGTIAMVPGLLLVIMSVGGVRITPRRVGLVVVSGLVVIAAFAMINYLVPATGHSDIGAFAGQAVHGGAGDTLQRKISTNLRSLTGTPFNLVIPAAVLGFGVLLLRPHWFGAGSLNEARRAVQLLGVTLAAIWVLAMLGWLAEDSGVAVPGAMLPLVLPLVIAIVSSAPLAGEREPPWPGGGGRADLAPAGERPGARAGRGAEAPAGSGAEAPAGRRQPRVTPPVPPAPRPSA